MVALVFWIACTRSGCTCCNIVAKASQSMGDTTLNWKMKSWTVIRVIMWILCEQGVESSNVGVFVPHFVNLFNTTTPMLCRDVYSEAPMSHFLNRRVGMGCQALNFGQRSSYVLKMPPGTGGWDLLKGLRMVARALWRSEARRVVTWSETCTSRRRVQGRSQGTTLSASDLHNARATILNPFYNMEYK